MRWWLYPEQKEPDRAGLPVVVIAITMLVIVIICTGIRAVTWPGDKHVDLSFFGQAVVFPVIVMFAVINFILIFDNANRHYDETRLFHQKNREYGLKQYAHMRLVIAGWSTVTPLDEPALNMLKLEGDFPLAPKTPLKIPLDETFDVTHNEQIFNRLLPPLLSKLKTSYRDFSAAIWVRCGNENCANELR